MRSLYASEYAKGKALVDAMNTYLGGALPDCEAVALALHLVNAGFSTGDLSATYTMTGVIQQMLTVIEGYYGITLDQNSVNVARFITHLRYLFVRIHQHEQLDDEPEPSWNPSKPHIRKHRIVQNKLAIIVKMRLNVSLSEAEIAYLTLHGRTSDFSCDGIA